MNSYSAASIRILDAADIVGRFAWAEAAELGGGERMSAYTASGCRGWNSSRNQAGTPSPLASGSSRAARFGAVFVFPMQTRRRIAERADVDQRPRV